MHNVSYVQKSCGAFMPRDIVFFADISKSKKYAAVNFKFFLDFFMLENASSQILSNVIIFCFDDL